MAVVQRVFSQNKFLIAIKYYEIGVLAGGDLPLARIASSQACRLESHPPCQVKRGEAALMSFGPHQWQRHRQTRNPAPRGAKISLPNSLHRRRAGGMVGHDLV